MNVLKSENTRTTRDFKLFSDFLLLNRENASHGRSYNSCRQKQNSDFFICSPPGATLLSLWRCWHTDKQFGMSKIGWSWREDLMCALPPSSALQLTKNPRGDISSLPSFLCHPNDWVYDWAKPFSNCIPDAMFFETSKGLAALFCFQPLQNLWLVNSVVYVRFSLIDFIQHRWTILHSWIRNTHISTHTIRL